MEIIENCDEIRKSGNGDQGHLHCPSMRRMTAILDYYNSTVMTANSEEAVEDLKKQFEEFCAKNYGEKWLLEDYMHCISVHDDRESMAKMAKSLKYKCSGNGKVCGGMKRHFRDRTMDQDAVSFFIDTLDTMHFNVLHLHDVGLRVDVEVKVDDDQNEESLKDEALLKKHKVIQQKREQYSFQRLDDTANSNKYSMCSVVANQQQSKEGVATMDRLNEGILEKGNVDKMTVQNFQKFTVKHDYDTEAMQQDMAVHREDGQSNVLNAVLLHLKLFLFASLFEHQ